VVKKDSRSNSFTSKPFPSSQWTRWYEFWAYTALYLKVTTVLVSACNLFLQCLLYKLMFLVLLLCWDVTPKMFGIWSWNFAEYTLRCVDYIYWKCNLKIVSLCRVVAVPVTFYHCKLFKRVSLFIKTKVIDKGYNLKMILERQIAFRIFSGYIWN